MDIIERLYDWLISHVKGEILAINQAFVVQPDIICNGIEVHEITLKADFVIRMDEEVIWGIFSMPKNSHDYAALIPVMLKKAHGTQWKW